MDRRKLAVELSMLRGFSKPKRFLEQYPTDPETASSLLWTAFMCGDLEGRVVADLGCGTGVLSYGALILGAREVLCVDIDADALNDAKRNLRELSRVHLILADVRSIPLLRVDTVIMNPPFGVVKRGMDLRFLEVALRIARRAVYTIHKFNEESHRLIVSKAIESGFSARLIEVRSMFIPALYETHKRRVHRFRVALYVFKRVKECGAT